MHETPTARINFNKPSLKVRPNINGPRERSTGMKRNELKIDLDVNSKVLVAQFKAISKHTAALAVELEQIDRDDS